MSSARTTPDTRCGSTGTPTRNERRHLQPPGPGGGGGPPLSHVSAGIGSAHEMSAIVRGEAPRTGTATVSAPGPAVRKPRAEGARNPSHSLATNLGFLSAAGHLEVASLCCDVSSTSLPTLFILPRAA